MKRIHTCFTEIRGITIVVVLFSFVNLIAQVNPEKRLLGYGLSPVGHPYDYSLFGEFLEEAGEMCEGSAVLSNAGWRDTEQSSGLISELPKVLMSLQPNYGYIPIFVFGWRSGETLYLNMPENPLNNWTNNDTKAAFLKMLASVADSLHPPYIFLGNENSFYREQDSADYLNWISFYNDAYDTIKKYSDDTKTGIVFNYEHLSGNGPLVGYEEPFWDALEVHDTAKIDILGLTVYPFFKYQYAQDVPPDYLKPVFDRWGDKEIAITETGWPAESYIGDWNCSPSEQVSYISRLFSMIENKNVGIVNWLFLNYMMGDHESDDWKIFGSVSLRDSLNNDRPGLSEWLNNCDNSSAVDDKMLNAGSVGIEIYPNPARDILYIKGIGNVHSVVSIYKTDGQLLKQISDKGISRIDINGLNDGMYIVKIINSDKVMSRKIQIRF